MGTRFTARRRHRFGVHVILLGVAAASTGAAGAGGKPGAKDPPKLSQEELKAGFRPLFNGRDLEGWQEVQGPPGSFTVKDGVLHGSRPRRPNRTAYWLSTTKRYADFELRLEYRISEGGNTGVFVRAPDHDGRTSRKGMEIQIVDDHGRTGSTTTSTTGAIYQAVAPRVRASKPAGQWNEMGILCRGGQVRVTLNGKVVLDTRMEDHDQLKNRPREGYIGLSAHTHTVWFRNIRLRVLRSPESKPNGSGG